MSFVSKPFLAVKCFKILVRNIEINWGGGEMSKQSFGWKKGAKLEKYCNSFPFGYFKINDMQGNLCPHYLVLK